MRYGENKGLLFTRLGSRAIVEKKKWAKKFHKEVSETGIVATNKGHLTSRTTGSFDQSLFFFFFWERHLEECLISDTCFYY
jgi:hypothetical protein